MAKFKLEPDGEVSGVYRNGETWSVTFDANGTASIKDAEIAETFASLAALSDHPLTLTKGN